MAEMQAGPGMGIGRLGGLGSWTDTLQNLVSEFGKAGSKIISGRYGQPDIAGGTRVVRDAQGNLIQISRQSGNFPLPEANLGIGANIDASPMSGTTVLLIAGLAVGAVFLLRK